MSDIMFRIVLKQIEDNKNYTVASFEIINPSTSETSTAPKLAFSSGLTVRASCKELLSFTVNGKSLDMRSADQVLTNEIHVFQTVPPLYTTYRTKTYRTQKRAEQVPIHSRSKEILQLGDIPSPSCGSTLTSIKSRGNAGTAAVIVGGNILANLKASAVELMMGKKNIWQEQSSGCIHLLQYDLTSPSFTWKKIPFESSPRAHHSAMLSDQFLFIFGGVNYNNNIRYDLRPGVIDVTTLTVTVAIIPDDFHDLYLSGHPFLQVNETKCLMVGGYTTMLGKENDYPTDTNGS